MATIDEICESVRLRLGDPRAQAPNDQAVLNQVCSQTRILLRHKRATGNPWDFNDLIITVQPNNATYQITQSDFGQALAVVTHDPTNPTWIPRMVKIYEPQNFVLNIPALPNQWASYVFLPYDNSNCTAQRVAFYWHDNNPFAEFWPLPQLQAQYKVRYLQNVAGQVGQQALTASPLPNEDADLAEIRAALGLLAISEWWEPSLKDGRAANAERRRDLLVTLQADEKEARRQFEAAQLITTGPRVYQRNDFSTV
jgi:hypothetical protein